MHVVVGLKIKIGQNRFRAGETVVGKFQSNIALEFLIGIHRKIESAGADGPAFGCFELEHAADGLAIGIDEANPSRVGHEARFDQRPIQCHRSSQLSQHAIDIHQKNRH